MIKHTTLRLERNKIKSEITPIEPNALELESGHHLHSRKPAKGEWELIKSDVLPLQYGMQHLRSANSYTGDMGGGSSDTSICFIWTWKWIHAKGHEDQKIYVYDPQKGY